MTFLKNICRVLVAVPMMVWAANVVVPSGETREIDVDNYNTYVCAGEATIRFSSAFPESSRGGYCFNGHFLLTNDMGTVTLDVTQLPDRAQGLHLLGHIIASAKDGQVRESLQVKGTRKLYIGADSGISGLSGWDVANVAFLDDDGNDVTSSLGEGEGVLFAGFLTVWRKPECRYEVLAGADVALGIPAADLGYYMPDGNNEIVLADKELYVIQTNQIDNTATIRVQQGRRFTFKPVTRTYPWSWTGSAAIDLRNPVVLESGEGGRSTLIHRSSKSVFIAGPVTGDGDFEFITDNYGSPCGGLVGTLDFTGTVYVHGNVAVSSCAKTPADFYIATNCPGHVDNTLKIGGSTKTIFAMPPVARFPQQLWPGVSVKVLQGVAESGYVGELDSVLGQTVTVQRVTGPVRLGGSGTFVFEQIDADAVLTVLPSCKMSFSTSTLAQGAKIVLASDQDNQSFELSIDGKACIVEPLAGVRAVTNAVLDGVMPVGSAQTYRIHGGDDFSYRLKGEDESWRSLLTFWVDPTNLARQVALDFATTNDNPHLEMIHDAREGQPYLLQNNYQRTAAGGQSGNWHKSQSPYMYLARNDGPVVNSVRLPYLSTGGKYTPGGARRFYAGAEGTTPYAATSIPAKFVVMVIDAHQGGGMSIIKDSSGGTRNVFARCNTTETPDIHMPIFTNATFTTWVDGVQVDPTQRDTLKPSWQILSFRTGGWSVGGFGYNTVNYQNGGGINYGDIMIFSEELTDAQRKDVERRLAAKWGIAYQEVSETANVAVNGSGTIEVDAKTAVAPYGLFRGTIDLAEGATLVVGAHPGVPTAEDVQKIGGRVNWFDPEAEGRVVLVSENSPQVSAVYDREDDCTVEGNWFMFGSGSRYPWVNESSRSIGAPVRKWIDFSYAYADNLGNVLRYRPTPVDKEGNSDTGKNYSRAVKTVCSVYDSSRLGTPFLDAIAGSGLVQRRESISDPIWTAKTSAILKNGKQYLNGHEVDGTTTPFGGKAEVFSFTTDGRDFPLMCMGDYQASQKESGGVILGEAIFFDHVLPDADRQMIEAYLSAKWLGTAIGDATDLSDATVVGAGTVVSPDRTALPQLGEGFTGTVSLTNETPVLAFTLNADTVVNPLDLQGGTLTVPGSSVVVSVAFTAKAAAESYKLMSWREGNAPAVAFALADNQPTGEVRSARYTLRKDIDGLYLDVQPSGTVFILR